MAAAQSGQCQSEEAWILQVPVSTDAEELGASSCRHSARRETRKRLATNPKWRIRTNPLGSTCKKRHGEHDVEVVGGQEFAFSCLQPALAGLGLTLGAVSIP